MEKYFSYEKILELDPHILQKYIQWIFPNNETSTTPHEDHDIEELQAIFYSFIESQQYFEHIYEISCQFNESYELINMILESNLYKLTPFLYDQLLESSTSVVAGIGKGYGEIIPCLFKDNHIIIPINITKIGDILILFDDSTEENITLGDDIYVVCDKIIKGYRIISYGLRFGYHELEFHTNILSNKSRNYLITNSILFTSSPVYTYCLALDSCLDYLTWGWTGNWTNELEIAILELLISVNDDLVTILLNMRSMFSGIFSTGVDDLEEMLKIIQEDLRLVLTTKSNYSLGRLHQTFLQFLEMNNSITGAFMKIPQQFIQAIEAFYLAKISASPLENLFNEILTLVRYFSFFFFSYFSV